jgi:hypothetical protein
MRLWGRRGRDDEEQKPVSDKARLEELLRRLADDIADDDRDNRTNLGWSREVRGYADLVGAGKPSGLEGLFRLFDPDPRNTINEQLFTSTRTFAEAMALARKLWDAHRAEEGRLLAAEREVVLRPWSDGSTGKAVVYADGTVVTSEDDASGEPQFTHVKDARQRRAPVALVGIRPDGSCEVQRNLRDEGWLAAALHDHDSRMHLT